MPMCLILPAFSSPDLKAFPLHLRHYRSSGSAPSLPNLPRAGRVGRFAPNGETVCFVPLRSTNPTDSPDTRISVEALVVLSDSLCLWRKDPYLPSQPFSVRHLPRTNVLASYGICRQFPHPLSRTRKPPSNTIGQRELTDASASVLASPSCPARMKQWCIISMVVNQQL